MECLNSAIWKYLYKLTERNCRLHVERVLGSWVVWLPKRMPRLHVTGVKVTNISESEATSYALFLVKSKKRKKEHRVEV